MRWSCDMTLTVLMCWRWPRCMLKLAPLCIKRDLCFVSVQCAQYLWHYIFASHVKMNCRYIKQHNKWLLPLRFCSCSSTKRQSVQVVMPNDNCTSCKNDCLAQATIMPIFGLYWIMVTKKCKNSSLAPEAITPNLWLKVEVYEKNPKYTSHVARLGSLKSPSTGPIANFGYTLKFVRCCLGSVVPK